MVVQFVVGNNSSVGTAVGLLPFLGWPITIFTGVQRNGGGRGLGVDSNRGTVIVWWRIRGDVPMVLCILVSKSDIPVLVGDHIPMLMGNRGYIGESGHVLLLVIIYANIANRVRHRNHLFLVYELKYSGFHL